MNAWEAVMALGRWGQTHPRTLYAGMGGALALGALVRVLSGGARRQRDMHGSARWATYGEVKRSGLSRKAGVVVGVMQKQTWYDNGPKHVFLVAPTRAGKGVFHIQPTLGAGWRHSALVLDPKRGENYDLTQDARRNAGRVEAFAPYQRPLARINVLDTIRLRTLEEHSDALTIAQSLVAPQKMVQENATSLHFRELAALLLTAALLHVCYTVERPSLAACWHFLTQTRTLKDCLKAMRRTRHTPYGVHPTIAQFTQAMRNITGDRELSSVWTTVVRPLSLYADPLIAASTDTSTLDVLDLQQGTEPLSLYLLAPSPRSLERLFPVYRVLVDVALARLTDRPVQEQVRRLLVVAEELPAYGYIHALNKGASDMAGYGIKGLFVAQDLDQFEDTYGTKNTIWGNTETKIFHAPDNEKTAERISRSILGAATVESPVQSRQGFLRDGSVSYQHVERPLLTTDEVQSLDPSQMIVRRTGSKPMLLTKLGYDPAKRKEERR
jgi:type IV secretion system protein VirD4